MQINLPNLTDAYWRADNGRIYSSAQQKIVTKDDAGLADWVEAGNMPIVWPRDDEGAQSNAALHEVLASYGMEMGGFTAIPASVTSAQAKIQLRRMPGVKAKTLREDFDATVAGADGETQDWYAEERTWLRGSPYFAKVCKALNLSATQGDDVFINAAKIAV